MEYMEYMMNLRDMTHLTCYLLVGYILVSYLLISSPNWDIGSHLPGMPQHAKTGAEHNQCATANVLTRLKMVSHLGWEEGSSTQKSKI